MSYSIYIHPQALKEAQATPGHMRQRLKRILKSLAGNPRPAESRALEWPPASFEPRRLRLGDWRIIYVVDDNEYWVEVLAVRKRPPYDYGDLADLLDRLKGV